MQGDVISIVNDEGTRVADYSYDVWGRLRLGAVGIGLYNPIRYRGYCYDDEISMYYLQSRYYDPAIGRFINADDTEYIGHSKKMISYNIYAYCRNNSVNFFDPLGTRTYFINGINNSSSTGIPDYVKKFNKKLSGLGVKDLRAIGIYKTKKSGFRSTINGVAKVMLAMLNVDTYTSYIVSIIKQDIKNKPLAKGEQLNLIGYSGGGQVVLNVMTTMANKFNNCVLIGSPICKSWKSTTKVSIIYAA